MSGHFEPLLLGMGAATIGLAVWLAGKMDLIDREGVPIHFLPRVFGYNAWLAKEVVASNIAVGKRVLAKELELEPSVLEVEDGQTSDAGRALYGNSITLTPGTVTVEADGQLIRVHALTKEAADDLRKGEMQRRVAHVDTGKGHTTTPAEGRN